MQTHLCYIVKAMPILKSALKRMRSDKKRYKRNQTVINDLKTRIKKFDALVAKKGSKDLNAALKTLISKVDKAASKGVIHKNKASRLISRLTKKLKRSGST